MSKSGGTCALSSPLEVKLGRGHSGQWKKIRWETKILTKLFCQKRQKEETWVDYQTINKHCGQKDLGEDEITRHGWACNEQENAAIFSEESASVEEYEMVEHQMEA